MEFWAAATEVIPGLPGGATSLGVIAIALLIGQYSTYRWVVTPERERSTKYENEVLRLNSITMDRVIPALVSATDTLLETQRFLAKLDQRAVDASPK